MQERKALSRPQRVELVLAALHDIAGVSGITVSPVHAYSGSRPPGQLACLRALGANFIKLETVVPEEIVETVVAAIAHAGHSGRDGDGIVFVVPVDQACGSETSRERIHARSDCAGWLAPQC